MPFGSWVQDPGDLVAGLVILVSIFGLGVSFVQSALEGMFHE